MTKASWFRSGLSVLILGVGISLAITSDRVWVGISYIPLAYWFGWLDSRGYYAQKVLKILDEVMEGVGK